jgi:hypothetical protein
VETGCRGGQGSPRAAAPIGRQAQVMKLLIMQFSPISRHFIGPNILLSTMFSNTFSKISPYSFQTTDKNFGPCNDKKLEAKEKE